MLLDLHGLNLAEQFERQRAPSFGKVAALRGGRRKHPCAADHAVEKGEKGWISTEPPQVQHFVWRHRLGLVAPWPSFATLSSACVPSFAGCAICAACAICCCCARACRIC